jgi:micrococcal nuclease
MANDNKYYGRVTAVLDGDTFEVMIELGFGVKQEFHVRLDGIDTPEKNTEAGKKAKQLVSDLILNKEVILQDKGAEKYGRARASIELMDGTDLTKYLIEHKIGKEYHGGKKQFAELTACGVATYF